MIGAFDRNFINLVPRVFCAFASYELTLACEVGILSMDDSSYRLNFDLGKKNEIHHHS